MTEFKQDYYEKEIFKKYIFEHGEVKNVEFHDCNFLKSSFSETIFNGCVFNNCVFVDCDLGLIKVVNSSFVHTRFERSKMIGINWASSALGKKDRFKGFNPIRFYDCVLNYSIFTGLNLEKLQIEKCVAKEVDFSEANLKNANFNDTDLSGSLFNQTDLKEANFVGAKNYMIVPGSNVLKGAKFSMPEAMALLYSMEIEIVEELMGEDS